MKRVKVESKKWVMISSVLVLFLGLFFTPFHSYANDSIFFTSVNDKLLTLRDNTMPQWIDGQLYVPYTTFDQNTTGISSGTYGWKQGNVVTIAKGDIALTFDLSSGLCYDEHSRKSYPYQATLRNGTAFVPVAGVCNFLQMSFSYQKIEYGYLLRIKGEGTVLTDARFIDAADISFRSYLADYEEWKNPTPMVPDPVPEVQVEVEEEIPEEEEEVVETPWILAVDMVDYNVGIPSLLEERNISAIFFFSVEQLENQGNLLRRLMGQGHSIGLEVTGDNLEEVHAQIILGNALLTQQTRTATQIVFTTSQWFEGLKELGYVPWTGGEAKELYSASSGLQAMQVGSLQYLTLLQTEKTGQVMGSFLTQALEKGYLPQVPTEDKL